MPNLDWYEIESSDKFQKLNKRDQSIIKLEWFRNTVAPTEKFQKLSEQDKVLTFQGFFAEDQKPAKQEAPEQEGNFITDIPKALVRGLDRAGEAIGGAMEMAHIPGGEYVKNLYGERAERPEIAGPKHLNEGTVWDNPERWTDPRWYSNLIFENLPNMALMMAPGAAGYRLGKAAGMGAKAVGRLATGGAVGGAFTVEAGSAYNQAKQEMLKAGYDEDRANKIATAEGVSVGVINAMLEVLPFANLIKNPGNKKLIARAIRQGFLEAGTEGVQENVSMVVAKLGHQPDVKLNEWLGRTVESMVAGGFLGAGTGAVVKDGIQPDAKDNRIKPEDIGEEPTKPEQPAQPDVDETAKWEQEILSQQARAKDEKWRGDVITRQQKNQGDIDRIADDERRQEELEADIRAAQERRQAEINRTDLDSEYQDELVQKEIESNEAARKQIAEDAKARGYKTGEVTATNPDTGERIVYRNGKWEPITQPSPQPEAQVAQPAQLPAEQAPEPVEAPTPPAVPTQGAEPAQANDKVEQDREKLTQQKQMLEDIIETNRINNRPVNQQHLDKLAEITDQLRDQDGTKTGPSWDQDAVASDKVFGHPEATDIGVDKYYGLVPIRVKTVESIDRNIDRAQKALDDLSVKLSTAEAIVKKRIKSTPKKMKEANKYLASHTQIEDETIRDAIRNETLPELYRLRKILEDREALKQPTEATKTATVEQAPTKEVESLSIDTMNSWKKQNLQSGSAANGWKVFRDDIRNQFVLMRKEKDQNRAGGGYVLASKVDGFRTIAEAREWAKRNPGVPKADLQPKPTKSEAGEKVSKVKSILGNDVGSAQVINDIAEHAYRLVEKGTKTFKDFVRQMRERFGDVWDSIKHSLKKIWKVVSAPLANQRGEVTIREAKEPKKPSTQKQTAKKPEQIKKLSIENLVTEPTDQEIIDHIDKNYVSVKDLGRFKRAESPPHWIAKRFPEFDKIYKIQRERVRTRMAKLAKTLREVESFIGLSSKDTETLSQLIFQLENKQIKEVTEKKYTKTDDGLKQNEKHYKQIDDFLQKKGYNDSVRKAYVDARRSLDKDLLTVYKTMAKMPDIDESVIQKFRESIGNIHNYFPHMRYGNYFVQVTDKDGSVVFREHFDAQLNYRQKAKKILRNSEDFKRIRAENPGYQIQMGKVKSLPEDVFSIPVPIEALEAVMNSAIDKMPDAESKEAFRQLLPEAVSDALKARGWGAHMIKRKNIPGFETKDIKRVLFDYKSGLYGWLSKMEASRDFSKAMLDIDAKSKPVLWGAARQYTYDMLSNSDKVDRMVNNLRAVFFAKYLGLNIKTAVLNTTQNIIAGWPRLGLEVGGSFGKVIKGAASDIVAAATGGKNLTESESKLLFELYQEGTTHANFLTEVRGTLGNNLHSAWNKGMRIMGYPMEVAERFNRSSLALAAFRSAVNGKITNPKTLEKYGLQKGEKAKYEVAKDFAEEVVDDAHFVYGTSNRPEMFRGKPTNKLLSTAYTFRTFTHNLLKLWSWMLRNGGKAAFMKSVGAMIAIGGMSSIPLYKTFMHILRQATGEDPGEELLDKMLSEDQDELREMVMYGLPSVAGFTLGGSIGMELPILEKIDLDKSVAEQIGSNFMEIIGIPYAIINDVSRGFEAYGAGQKSRLIESIAPTFMGNVAKAYRMREVGQTTISGKPIALPGSKSPRKLTLQEAIGQMWGFQPTANSKGYDVHIKVQDFTKYKQAKQKEFANRIVNSLRQKNLAEYNRVGRELISWNKKQIKSGHPEYVIRHEDLRNSLRSRLNAGQPPKFMLPRAIELRNKYFGRNQGE